MVSLYKIPFEITVASKGRNHDMNQTPSISALRPYSPGDPLNGFPTALNAHLKHPMPSGYRLQLGLPGFLVR